MQQTECGRKYSKIEILTIQKNIFGFLGLRNKALAHINFSVLTTSKLEVLRCIDSSRRPSMDCTCYKTSSFSMV